MRIKELRQDTPAEQLRVLAGAIRGWLLLARPTMVGTAHQGIEDITFALDICANHVANVPWSPNLSRKPLYRMDKNCLDDKWVSKNGVTLTVDVNVHILEHGTTGDEKCVTLVDPNTGEVWENVLETHIEMVTVPTTKAVVSQAEQAAGIEVEVVRSQEDGKLVVRIDGPEEDKDLNAKDGSPDIRVWLNEALIYNSGEVGDDLSDDFFEQRQAKNG